MTATYMVAHRWYFIDGATIVGGEIDPEERYKFFEGWIWVTEKKYHTDHTVTIIGMHDGNHATNRFKGITRRVVLEMRRNLTVQTLRTGPPAYVIQEQVLT